MHERGKINCTQLCSVPFCVPYSGHGITLSVLVTAYTLTNSIIIIIIIIIIVLIIIIIVIIIIVIIILIIIIIIII